MTIIETGINGLKIIENDIIYDERGYFKKKYSQSFFTQADLNCVFKEILYTCSKKNVVRGMHFQIPPKASDKLVFVIKGKITDVCLDIRKKSLTYNKYLAFELSEEDNKAIYVPKGIAHGFLSHENDTIVAYAITENFSSDCDKGIRFDSFGYTWQVDDLIVSKKDKAFPRFKEFNSPF